MPPQKDPWEDVSFSSDPWEDVSQPQEPGMLQKWNELWINQPLSRKVTWNGQQLFDPQLAANYYDPIEKRSEDQWRIPELDIPGIDLPEWMQALNPSGGSLRALGAGMLEGAGNVVEGLTTPLNLATMGTGAVANRAFKTATTLPALAESAYTTAPQVANVARRATQALSAPVIATGAARTAEGIRTGNWMDVPLGITEMASGGAGMLMPKPPAAQPVKPPTTVFDMDLPLNTVRHPNDTAPPAPPNIPEFAPVDAPTAAPQPPTFTEPAMPGKAAVNPLRPEIPPGQLTNAQMGQALTNRAAQEAPPIEPIAPAIPNEFAPVEPVSQPGGEFVDPTTGEIRSADLAQPGDIVLPTGPVQAPSPVTPPRRPRNMILTEEGRTPAPTSFKGWLDELTKGESGTFDPENLSENLRARVRDLGLDSIDIQQLPNSIYYYARTGANEIVDYLLHNRLWPNYRNMSRGEIDPHLAWYVRQGNPEIAQFLSEQVHARDAAAQNVLADSDTGVGIPRGPGTPYDPYADQFAGRESERTQPIAPETTREPLTTGVPEWNRREMDTLSPDALERYVQAYADGPRRTGRPLSPESQAIIEYGNALLAEQRSSQAGGFEVDRARQTEYNQQREEAFSGLASSRVGESYESVAQQIEGMTSQEAVNYINEMSDNLYPEDVDPMIEVLTNRTQTDGTRTVLNTLLERQRGLQEQGIATGPRRGESSYSLDVPPDVRTSSVGPRGKTLAEVEEAKTRPALERLGRMIGEDRARQLAEGETEISFNPARPARKKVDDYSIRSWGRWATDTINDYVDRDPTRPGKEVTYGEGDYEWNREKLTVKYRNENGDPIGYLEGDKSGIHTLAVDPTIGLRRGRVAFEMLKEAMDRGITEPSGSTSELTKNLVNRIKRLAARASRELVEGEKGELVIPESVIKAINDAIDKIKDSRLGVFAKKAGKAVGEFIRDESGSSDADMGLEKLKAFYQRIQRGEKLSEAETTEARLLARMVKENEVITQTPKSMQNPPFETSGEVPRGSTIPRGVRGERLPRPIRLPSGSPEPPNYAGRTVSSEQTYPQRFPEMETAPEQPAGRLPMLGPTREPRLGPRRPRQPYVEQNPQIVQDLHQRIREAFEQQLPKNQNLGPAAVNKLMEDYLKVAKDNPEHLDQGVIRQVLGANKALLTSWDISAPGRQGKAFILNKEFWKALPGMIRAWGNEGAANAIKQSIVEHPSGYFQRGINQAGKPMKSLAEVVGLDIAPVEEMFVNTRAPSRFNKYSGIERSSRAHTAFLSKLRADMFVNFMEAGKALGLNPETNLHLAKSYATFINNATGRGSLDVGKWKLSKVGNEINDAFFAARNMSGQIRTWNQVLNPMKYAGYDPVLRKQALKSLFALAGVGLLAGEVMREFMGAKVSNDPTSSDFRKVRYGDARIDFFGGYGQFPIAAMKLITGTETPTSGQDAGKSIDLTQGGWRTRGSVAQRFLTNRLSPAGSFVWAWMNNREFDGKPFEVKRALYERTFPIAMKDMWELAQEDPGMALLLSPLIISGVASTQTYSGGR